MPTNLIITGLPRSGTSFLCARLNSISNMVVLNEPTEIPQAFKSNKANALLAAAYDDYRAKIINDEPILNKIKNGKFIEDTHENDSRTHYTPKTDSNDFILGMKNTLVFLSNIHRIRKWYPHLAVAACVRHPLDTVGSWSRVSFPHINSGQPKFLLDMVDNKVSKTLSRIIEEPSKITRYGLLWCFLTHQILQHKKHIHIIRYEDLIKDTHNTLKPLTKTLFNYEVDFIPSSNTPPQKREELLSTQEINVIKKLCSKRAVALGYNFR